MTTFKTFLLEAGSTRMKEISVSKAIELLKKNCAKSIKNHELYRGGGDEGVFLGNSEAGKPRASANTYNFYTLMIDNSPAWSSFPKRSRSFIGTSDPGMAEDYGQLLIMIPYDNAKIGICPESDMWFSFKLFEDWTMEDFHHVIAEVLESKNIDPNSIKTWAGMQKQFSKVTIDDVKSMKSDTSSDQISLIKSDLLQLFKRTKANNLFELYEKIVNPKNFKVTTGAQYKNPSGKSHEVWVQGNAIFFDPDYQDDIMSSFK